MKIKETEHCFVYENTYGDRKLNMIFSKYSKEILIGCNEYFSFLFIEKCLHEFREHIERNFYTKSLPA